MSENAGLKVFLQANADQLNAAIAKATAKIEELGAKIKSLPTGDKEFNKLSRELNKTSITQQNLIKSFDKLGTESEVTAPKIQKTTDASKSARTALASLSLTLQDLPFGFIGVQNNLPGIIQGFGNLTTSTKGELLPALKAIGQSLLGPAGIFLAFSGVTAGVTFLIKEYGSLGAGIDALLGKTHNYTKALNEAQKAESELAKEARTISQIQSDASGSYQASAIRLQALTEIVLDATKSDLLRKNALLQLKEIDNDRFKNFNIEKNALKGLQEATDAYTQSIINNAVIKEYESEIGKVTVNLNRQRDALFLLQKEFDKLNQDYPDLAEKAANFQKKLVVVPGQYAALPNILDKNNSRISDYLALQQKIVEQDKIVTDVEYKRFAQLENELNNAIKLSNELYNPKQGKKPLPKKEEILGYITLRKQESLIDEKAAKNLRKLNDELELNNKSFKGKQAPGIKQVIDPELFKNQKEWQDYLKKLVNDIKSAADIIGGAILNPLTDVLTNFLNTGKITFKEFGKVVLENLKRLTAQIIATGIVQLLATIVGGGFSPKTYAKTGLTGFQLFGKAFANALGFGGVTGANFGGLNPGGLAMSGAVSLSLRGSDLVGAINRTNTNINRIG